MLRSRQYRPLKSSSMDKEKTNKKSKLKYIIGGGLLVCILSAIILAYSISDEPSNNEKNFQYETVPKEEWKAKVLSGKDLSGVSNQVSMSRLKGILEMILIPRVPGSDNITIVSANIVSHLQQELGWKLTHDTFMEKPPDPYPMTTFRSLIATHNPKKSRRLILACHHDSKIVPEGFLGATDSAVPCSIMIEAAYALNKTLNELKNRQNKNDDSAHDITLQLVFLDGEEAFVSWTDTDSIYGARHLAAKWKRTKKIDSIDLFVLLDLIGTRTTVFRHYDATKTRWFDHAADLEQRMTNAGILGTHATLFQSHKMYNRYRIEDDHVPFQKEGVPIFHMISAPFPQEWHTINDNYQALDFDRIELVTKLIANFVAEYLHLSIET